MERVMVSTLLLMDRVHGASIRGASTLSGAHAPLHVTGPHPATWLKNLPAQLFWDLQILPSSTPITLIDVIKRCYGTCLGVEGRMQGDDPSFRAY